MKKYYYLWSVFAAFLLSLTFVSCGDSSDDDPDPIPVDPGKRIENNSNLLGTWINKAQDDLVYYLFFKDDGTGYYIKEGVQEVNFTTFTKRDFKWTAITTHDLATTTGTTVAGALGSIEINFTGGYTGTFKGDYQIGENGKMKIDEYSGFDKKSIFTKTNNLSTTADIKGLWKGDFEDTSSRTYTRTFSSFLRIDENGSGYYNEYQKDYYPASGSIEAYYSSFNGDLQPFSTYEVAGDIITLKDYVNNSVSGTKELVSVMYLRFKKNDIGGYNIASSVSTTERAIAKVSSAAAGLSASIGDRIWWDGDTETDSEENNVLFLKDNKVIYLQKGVSGNRTDNYVLQDTIIGNYELKDYNICIDQSYIQNGKKIPLTKYILVDRIMASNYMGFYNFGIYKKFTSTNIGTNITGTWILASPTDQNVTSYNNVNTTVDNTVTSEYSKLYYSIQFTANNQLYMRKLSEDIDYLTCVYIATNGKLFFFDKKTQTSTSTSIKKQYEWEVINGGTTLLLKYKNSNRQHVIVYTKK